MPKIPVVTARKMIKVLKKRGFVLDRSAGSHHIFRHPQTKFRAVLPVHAGRDLGRGITLSILEDAHISVNEFLKLL